MTLGLFLFAGGPLGVLGAFSWSLGGSSLALGGFWGRSVGPVVGFGGPFGVLSGPSGCCKTRAGSRRIGPGSPTSRCGFGASLGWFWGASGVPLGVLAGRAGALWGSFWARRGVVGLPGAGVAALSGSLVRFLVGLWPFWGLGGWAIPSVITSPGQRK